MSTELTLSALLILYPLTVFYVVVAARFLSMNAAVFLELLVVMSPFWFYEKNILLEMSSGFALRGLPGAEYYSRAIGF